MFMKKILLILFLQFAFLPKAFCAKHFYREAIYQHAWCQANSGIEEYKNKDCTRVDCLTDTHAVEFDFASKWAESIGQALHYKRMTGKRAKVVLIIENPSKECIYFHRTKALGDIYDFDVEYITPQIMLNLSKQCPKKKTQN